MKSTQDLFLNIFFEDEDDEIQTLLMKLLFILRHRQKKEAKHKYAKPIAEPNWAIFWKIICQYSLSIISDQDDNLNRFLMMLFESKELDYLENVPISSKVDICVGKWLPLYCNAFYSTASDNHSQRRNFASTNESHLADINETPLHLASMANNPNINTVKHLIKYFPQMVHTATSKDQIPLHYAANFSNNVEIIELLIEAYPQGLETRCEDGDVPLFNACRNLSENSSQIVQRLLQASPQTVTLLNDYGDNPLHVTVRQRDDNSSLSYSYRRLEIIQTLLTAFPEGLMDKNERGNTPLHSLCGNGDISQISSAVELLLSVCPAAASVLNENGGTPLSLLLHDTEDQGKDLNILVPMLLDVYPEAVSVKDDFDCYPIHYAVMNELNLTLIERIINGHPGALLKRGKASPDFSSLTPLQAAIIGNDDSRGGISESYDRLALVKYLYSKCPESIHIRSERSDTALHLAVTCCTDSKEDKIVEAVYHMDPTATMSVNYYKQTPLCTAIESIFYSLEYPFSCPGCIYFLLKMCPDAILVRRATRNNLYEYVCQYNDEDTKRTDEIRDLLCRMLLLTAPDLDPQALCKLNYRARRMAMFMFFSAIYVGDHDNNIFTKLREFDPYIVRRIIMFL